MSGLGDDEIDPAMMAALMATTALVAQGASNEEVSKAIQLFQSKTSIKFCKKIECIYAKSKQYM